MTTTLELELLYMPIAKYVTNGDFPYRLTKMAKNVFANYRIFTLENRIEIWIAFSAVKKISHCKTVESNLTRLFYTGRITGFLQWV